MSSQLIESPAVPALGSQKITAGHLDRLAVVYIRQSSPQQVRENRESRERQYSLRDHAGYLGWPKDRVLVIDEDQGLSGKGSSNRPGFQRLLAEVSLNHVGLVLGLELSRLSRSSRDWHQLVEVCAVFNTLLGDQDGLYDANDSNDRLLLGMKGAMSEFELVTLRNRMERGRDNKAARGELVLLVPIGYQKLPVTGEVILESDEQAQSVVRLVFEKFRELGTAWKVFRYLIEHDIQLGYRCQRGAKRGQLEWRRAEPQRVMRILHHPMYAGAYAYGMHSTGNSFRSPDDFRVLIHDRFPAYITWEEYLANQQRLKQNQSSPATPGATRAGSGLLAGLACCGQCGYRMKVAHKKRHRCQYACDSHLKKGVSRACSSVSATEVDELVVTKVLQVLEPAALQLSLRTSTDVERERQQLHQHWRRKLDQARYEAERIERQYQQVEPENRRVARTLETRWDQALQAERKLCEDYDRFLQTTPAELSASERARIEALSTSIPQVWNASGTTSTDRKDIIRCLVDRVDVAAHSNSEFMDVTIHWKGRFTSQHEIPRSVGTYRQLRDYNDLVQRLRDLHEKGLTISQIAEQLNEEGFVPPRRRGRYTGRILAPLLKQLGLVGEHRRTDILRSDEWWVRDLAKELGVGTQKVYYWIKQQWLHARRSPLRKHWIAWADADEIKRLKQLARHGSSWTAARVPELTTPKFRPKHC